MTMRFTRVELTNWKNFPTAQANLASRVFLIGPNATGKSNFLDVFRFLRDLTIEGGGLAKAVEVRGGMRGVRSLYARQQTAVEIKAVVKDSTGEGWRYELSFTHATAGSPAPLVEHEAVYRLNAQGNEEEKLSPRPDKADKADRQRLTQTALQQVTANQAFRELAAFFRSIAYLHIVPQLLREEQTAKLNGIGPDPFGRDLLDRIRNTKPRARQGRLSRIQKVLKVVAPHLEELDLFVDDHGRPHLRSKFKHWRGFGAYQNETQFSDGTLRLIGLLWALQEKAGPLLLEEPELSLHTAIVRRLAPFIHRVQKGDDRRQVILSTHSESLLMDIGIAPEEVLLVQPAEEGSKVVEGASIREIVDLMQSGIPAGEAILPRTETQQMAFFDKLGL
jgi:predicted ATPase